MRDSGVFSLIVRHDITGGLRVDVTLAQYATNSAGHILIASDCDSVEDLEGQINAILDDLDQLRIHARRLFLDATPEEA